MQVCLGQGSNYHKQKRPYTGVVIGLVGVLGQQDQVAVVTKVAENDRRWHHCWYLRHKS